MFVFFLKKLAWEFGSRFGIVATPLVFSCVCPAREGMPLFRAFGGVTGGETDGMLDGQPVQQIYILRLISRPAELTD